MKIGKFLNNMIFIEFTEKIYLGTDEENFGNR